MRQIQEFVEKINEPNFYVAPSTALILSNQTDYKMALESLRNIKMRILLVSAPEVDNYGVLWNVNCPIYRYSNHNAMKELFDSVSESTMILDGMYPDKDQEYLDIKIIENP